MNEWNGVKEFLEARGVLYDVRSPSEYKQGSIPGALNLPLFSDEERAQVGTVYKQDSQENALKLGLKFVGPKLASFVAIALEGSLEKKAKLYCWRGGMRSQSMSWLLGIANLSTETLPGGYKRFRRWVLDTLSQRYPFIVLGGMTGSGKTAILRELAKGGEQILDLEMYANHRGSAFGMFGLAAQPTTEHFENLIAVHLSGMDKTRPIWLEDESRLIGLCKIPDPLYLQMCQADQIHIQKPLQERLDCLMDIYGAVPPEELIAAVQKIGKRLGGQHMQEAVDAIRRQALKKAVELVLNYYDKAYAYAGSLRGPIIQTFYKENQPADAWADDLRRYLCQNYRFPRKYSS